MIKILYIDDEADSEKMASKFEIMKDEGIDAVRVTRVEDVLPTLEDMGSSIDLIALDLIIPPEDSYSLEETNGGTTTGLRLLEDIRRKHTHIPIIIVSIKRRGLEGEILKKHRVSEYLEKPITASDLVAAIKKTLGLSRTADLEVLNGD